MDKKIVALLIEDDPDDTELMLELMARPGWPSFHFTLMCAATLQEGLRLLAQEDIEVLLLDLMLKDSQGMETVLRARAQAPEIPIVVLTGLRDEAMGLEAISHGAQDYVIKGSLDAPMLKRTIRYAVERHEAMTRLETVIAKAADAMLVVDGKGVIRYANPASESLFDCPSRDLLGRPFPYPITAGYASEIKLPAQGGGPERAAEMRVTEIEWKGEAANLASIRDITQLRRFEELKAEIKERQRMDKLKDELVSAVSHELRSPLTIIRAAISNLDEGLAGPLSSQQDLLVNLAHKNVLRLQKIVDNVLNLSRLESGKAQIHARRMDACQLIRETAKGFTLLAQKRPVAIEVDFARDLPNVHADPDLFIQVLSNLLDNALRFTRSKVIVRAATAEAKETSSGQGVTAGVASPTALKLVQISVIDDGPGVPEDRIPDLFNKFVQIKRSSKEGGPYKGTGLGLAICREIVERQQGRIWAESRAGEGARFHFALPQAAPTPRNGSGASHAPK